MPQVETVLRVNSATPAREIPVGFFYSDGVSSIPTPTSKDVTVAYGNLFIRVDQIIAPVTHPEISWRCDAKLWFAYARPIDVVITEK